jgi:tetratricopeptide (TPR) repeat protein
VWLLLWVPGLIGCPKPASTPGTPANPSPASTTADSAPPAAPTPIPGPGATKTATVSLSVEQLQSLRLKALGELENNDFATAIGTLRELLAARPEDLFPLQNLAIATQLRFDAADPVRDAATFQRAEAEAKAAIAALNTRLPDAALAPLLSSRVAKKQTAYPQAESDLQEAVRREPDHATAWYDLYQVRKLLGATDRLPAIVAAGSRAFELQPENWFLLKDWIVDVVQAKDASAADVLTHARGQFAPLAKTLERDVRANPLPFLDRAIAAVNKDDWPTAIRSVGPVRNIVVAEAARDASLIDRHSLEFVRLDFSSDDLQRPAVPQAPEAIDVRWSPVSHSTSLPAAVATAFADIDLNGRFELLLLTGNAVQIWSASALPSTTARPDGLAEWTLTSTVALSGPCTGLLLADLDDDGEPPKPDAVPAVTADNPNEVACHRGDPELVVYGPSGLAVYENRQQPDGSRAFELRTESGWGEVRDVSSAVLFDLDHDGDLDVAAATASGLQLWIYRGNFQFLEISDRSSWTEPALTQLSALAVADWDRDIDLDLLAAAPDGLLVLENLRHGRFRPRRWEGSRFAAGATGLSIAELDGNGAWDVVSSGPAAQVLTTTRGVQLQGWPQELAVQSLSQTQPADTAAPATATTAALALVAVGDVDNDGWPDLAVSTTGTTGQTTIFRNTGSDWIPQWSIPTAATNTTATNGTSPVIVAPPLLADADLDGDLDLCVSNGTQATWQLNQGGNANHWVDVRIRALQEKGNGGLSNSRRVNHQGVGSLLELRTGTRYQAAIVTGQSTHFGLGSTPQADLLRILWTNGVPLNRVQPQANRVLCEEALPIGSCPYLYTWDGTQFVFVTDLLWNAPLGLKFAEDVVAPWREWEYLKIDGRQLQPKDGQYQLQITEELWEFGYFDQVELIAVDHPSNVEIFTNEKVGPPEIATPRLHGVTQPRRPIAARDQQDVDWLPTVLSRDDRFTRTATDRLASGLCREHHLELTFDAVPATGELQLVLTGWMFPTDTSLNVQFSQDRSMPRPSPPALWVPDDQGRWQPALPFMGFPGGKTKTIVVDVTSVLNRQDPRCRIVTNMEFSWDEAFLTVNEATPTVQEQVLTLTSADLHYRGFSQAARSLTNGPELYDYAAVSTVPKWPPLAGSLTRYGDVKTLLAGTDDQLVVMASGDELTLSFAALPPPPDGWTRDFVLHNVGWDKDAVLNTVHGATAEPLPFAAMTHYGHQEGFGRTEDPDYLEYLRVYQTRTQPTAPFWNGVRRPAADWATPRPNLREPLPTGSLPVTSSSPVRPPDSVDSAD